MIVRRAELITVPIVLFLGKNLIKAKLSGVKEELG